MMRFLNLFVAGGLLLVGAGTGAVAAEGTAGTSAAGEKLYENNFGKAEPGGVPEDFLILSGDFAVREEEGNKFLELPGTPLETFGLLFGPAETENVMVGARIFGTSRGRRAPAFGVGLGSVAGYKLQVTPAKNQVELFRNDELVTAASYQWKSGKWTRMLLQVVKQDGAARVRGKVWEEGAKEPESWLIDHEEKGEVPSGRPSIWGLPFATTPIRFDDLVLLKVEP